MTLITYNGKRRTTFGYRFIFRGHLYKATVSTSKALALQAEKRERRRLETAAFEGRWGPLQPILLTWEEAVQKYETAKAEKRSLRWDEYHLVWWGEFFARQGINYVQEISPELVDEAKAELRQGGRSPATIQRHLSTLRILCNLAVRRWNVLTNNPVSEVDWPRARAKDFPVPTVDDVWTLAKHAPVPVMRAIIVTAACTGFREGDVMRLEAADLQVRPGWIQGYGSKPDKAKWLPVIPPLKEELDGLGVIAGPLFRKPDGQPYRRFPRDLWNATKRAAKVTFRFHDLRHATGTILADAGVPQRIIQDWLGHSSGRVTERYTRPGEAGLQQAAKVLARWMRKGKDRTEIKTHDPVSD